jgi:hypothetical protein
VNLVLTVSNQNPLVDSTVTVTATVTNNGQPVANGTAVEFTTSAGVLDGGGTSTIKTTTNGVATVTLTSSSPGVVRVTVTVNNVTRQIDVTFVSRPVTPPPPNTAPSITSIAPTIGRPQGGEVIRITGTNFKAPVRVLFNTGGVTAVEGSVQAVTDTLIEVITPPVNLGAGQQLAADVIVLTQAGTASEQRVESSDGFTYRNEQLTPVISTVSPNSGPVTGGTRVTIFGEGFQEPVQVLFGTAEARVLNVQFDRINVETPAGRDTNPDGSGTVTGPVTVIVRNINSQTETSMASGFHYKAAIQITAVSPGEALYSGGTRVRIDGIGFVPPVTVTAAGVAAQVLEAYGSQIIFLSPAVQISGCAEESGPIVVTNVVNGDQADGPEFTFRVPPPIIVDVDPPVAIDGTTTSVDITVANGQFGVVRIKIGDKTAFPSGAVANPDGSVTYTVPLPTNFEFPTETCPTGGERLAPLDVDITYTNVTTGCTDTADGALTVEPADTSCVVPPPILTTTPASGGACAPVPNTVALGAATGNATITVTNSAAAGSQSLSVTSVTATSQVNGTFLISPASATIAAGASRTFTVTVDPTAVGPFSADINFFTNAGDTTVCVSGNGT